MLDNFKLDNEIVVITGGSGLLGSRYYHAIKEIGGIPISLDIKPPLEDQDFYIQCDITDEKQVIRAVKHIEDDFQKAPHGLINNAAIDPKMDKKVESYPLMLPTLNNYPIDHFMKEIEVGIKGALICTKIFGPRMVNRKRGSIINISSLLGIVAPNQNMYSELNVTKPIGYTIVKHAIIGLTRHIATEWAKYGVRCNALAPNGVFNNHPQEFVEKLTKFIPLGRMAEKDEYNSAIQFLLTDASKYMTGHTLVMDGGHSVW